MVKIQVIYPLRGEIQVGHFIYRADDNTDIGYCVYCQRNGISCECDEIDLVLEHEAQSAARFD